MKAAVSYISIVLLGTIFLKPVEATVGGPIYISNISYDPLSEIVYFLKNDYGQSGCPPVIYGMDISMGSSKPLKDCTQIREEFGFGPDNGYAKYIQDFFNDKEPIGSVSLIENNINIQLLPMTRTTDEFDQITISSTFFTQVYQNGDLIATYNLTGCTKEQPNLFEGYMIPDTDKMVLLVSRTGDCYEGGYIYEDVQLITGVDYQNKDIVRPIKEATQTEKNGGNMIVYAKSQNSETNKNTTLEQPKVEQPSLPPDNLKLTLYNTLILMFFGLVTFLAGFATGLFLKKKNIIPPQTE